MVLNQSIIDRGHVRLLFLVSTFSSFAHDVVTTQEKACTCSTSIQLTLFPIVFMLWAVSIVSHPPTFLSGLACLLHYSLGSPLFSLCLLWEVQYLTALLCTSLLPSPNHIRTSLLPSQIVFLPNCLPLFHTLHLHCIVQLLSFDQVGYVDETEFSNVEVGVVCDTPMPKCYTLYLTALKSQLEPCFIPSLHCQDEIPYSGNLSRVKTFANC